MNKKNIWILVSVILILILGTLFIFKNDIKAYKMGIDVKYLDNPTYCVQDSDCAQSSTCDGINIYNFKKNDATCEQSTCGSLCNNYQCQIVSSGKLCEARFR